MKKQAIGYARVSTGKQAKEGASIEMQHSCIVQMAHKEGYELSDVLSDEGLSGRKDTHKRQGYKRMLDLVRAKKVDCIFAYSLSRLGRKMSDVLALFELCDKHGVDIILYKDSIDTRTAVGKLIRNILISFNEFEADLASERTSDVAQNNKKEFKPYCNPPYGWKIENRIVEGAKIISRGELKEVPEEQDVINWILQKRKANKSLSWIAEELNHNEIKPKRGVKWSHGQVDSVIKTSMSMLQLAQSN